MISELDSGDKILLTRALEQMHAANGTMRFLSDYFRDKYGLTPQHQITPNGEIVIPQPSLFENLENSDATESPNGTLRREIRSPL